MSPYLVSTALTTEFDVAESSHDNPTRVDTVPREQAERKRKRPASSVSIHQGQPARKTDALSRVPRDTLDKWNRIADRETLTQLWLCLYAHGQTAWTSEPEDFIKSLLAGRGRQISQGDRRSYMPLWTICLCANFKYFEGRPTNSPTTCIREALCDSESSVGLSASLSSPSLYGAYTVSRRWQADGVIRE
jgi:hypothetical protein